MLRALLISILEEDYYNVDPGDYILLYMLSESLGPGALFAILAQAREESILYHRLTLSNLMQLSCTMEEACTPNLATWPQCHSKEENREGRILHTMEVFLRMLWEILLSKKISKISLLSFKHDMLKV